MGGGFLRKCQRVVRQPGLNSTRGSDCSCGRGVQTRVQTAQPRHRPGPALQQRDPHAQGASSRSRVPGPAAARLQPHNSGTAPSPAAARPQSAGNRYPHPNPVTPLPRDLGQPGRRETSAHGEALPSPQGREPSPGHTPPGPLPTCGRRTLTQGSGLPGLRGGDAQRSSAAPRGPKKWRRSPSAETGRLASWPGLHLSGRALRPPFANGQARPRPTTAAGQGHAAGGAPCRPGGRRTPGSSQGSPTPGLGSQPPGSPALPGDC